MYLSDPRAKAYNAALNALSLEHQKLFPKSKTSMTPSQEELIHWQNAFGPQHYHREQDIVVAHAEGVWIWDMEGKRYLDMNACYSAVALGYGDIELHGTLMEQGFYLTTVQNRLINVWQPQLIKRLVQITGLESAILKNAGTEAFDIAVKATRRWGEEKKKVPKNHTEIITASNNFHGRSIAAITASSSEKYRRGFGPFPPGFKNVAYGDIADLENAITENTVAFIVEVIQGEGGINEASRQYFQKVRKLCDKKDVLLIFDEIQTGLGRTGKLFASEWIEVRPDGMLMGKALGQEIPVSAFVSTKEVLDLLDPGSDGSTFAGSPLACALALKSLEIITRDNQSVVRNSHDVGAYFLKKLKKIDCPAIKEVRGKGLFVGIEFKKEILSAEKVFLLLKQHGLIAGVAGNNTVRFTPALVISKSEIDHGVDCIREALR